MMLEQTIEAYEEGCEQSGLALRQAMIALSESIYDRQFEFKFNDNVVDYVDTLD